MELTKSAVGRKILMAITGQLLIVFVIVHLLGNSSIFVGPNGINAYAEHLHSLGPLVWGFRAIMGALLVIHAIFGIQLSLENKAAKPVSYAVKNRLRANFSSETMMYTGLLILVFLVYHISHFTARITPDIVKGVDAAGRYDVFTMVVTSFNQGIIALIYAASMVVLFLHLSHGIQSFFQTMGWNNDKTLPTIGKGGKAVAAVLLVGYVSIPFLILAGVVKL